MLAVMSRLSWTAVLFLCLTIGLAPFSPPHVVEKLRMLAAGQLVRPIDWFDLAMHGSPWVLLALKIVVGLRPPTSGRA